jgi:Xaa-Pro aminopeptidase
MAHQPIVIDIFPRSSRTRYFADITRSVVRGKASTRVKAMYQAVLQAQEQALALIRDGADGAAIHHEVAKVFEHLGFATGETNGRMQGFFHGTGHGLGLEIHEPPRIGQRGAVLRSGNVVTVEPGLYYPGEGGVRIEDLVVVTDTGCRILTKFPKLLEL